MSIASLFLVDKTWTQIQRPSVQDWIKMCYINPMHYYSAIRKKEVVSFVEMTHVEMKNIVLSEIVDGKGQEPCDFTRVGRVGKR